MEVTKISAQSLRPLNFKAEPQQAQVEVEETQIPQQDPNKNLKIYGGSAVGLGALGTIAYFALRKKAPAQTTEKGKKAFKSVFKEIKKGVREFVNKQGETIRIYEGKNGKKLVTHRNKEGQLIRTIHTFDPIPPSNAAAVIDAAPNLNEKLGKIVKAAKPEYAAPGAPKVTAGTMEPVIKNPLKGIHSQFLLDVPSTKTRVVTNYLQKDGTISKTPLSKTYFVDGEKFVEDLQVTPDLNKTFEQIVKNAKPEFTAPGAPKVTPNLFGPTAFNNPLNRA